MLFYIEAVCRSLAAHRFARRVIACYWVFLGANYSLSALKWVLYLTCASSTGLLPPLWRSARTGKRLPKVRRMLYKIDLIIGLSTSSYGTTLIILQAMSFLRGLPRI